MNKPLTENRPLKAPKVNVVTPRKILLPYQRAWSDDQARFKIGLWSRQTGKDFSSAEEAVRDCFLTPSTQWTILATGERQALESVYQAKLWAEAYKIAVEGIREDREGPETLLRSADIILSNRSRLRALPANPATCRGLSTNLILTEFAFHESPDEIWRAIYPSISNPLRGGEKKLRIISTPNGRGNKFADIWFKNFAQPNPVYSCHKVTIHDAVAQGLPVNVDELRAGLDDPEGWAQEYECEFIDSSAILLPYELMAPCEVADATAEVPAEFWLIVPTIWQRFMGIDFGRKHDLTVAWTSDLIGDVLTTREVLEMAKTDTPTQLEHLRPRVKTCGRVAVDYTGPGVGLGDFLVKEFGQWDPEHHQFGKIELCTFSNTLKNTIFPALRVAFEQHRLRIPVSRAIREDLHSIHRVNLPSGQVTYRAPHTEDGHADRCTGLALCLHAAGKPAVALQLERITRTLSAGFTPRTRHRRRLRLRAA